MSDQHPTSTPVREELISLPALLPSDAINLATLRVLCKGCEGKACKRCKGHGSVAADTGREHLSQSSLSTLLNCEQKYAFQKVHGIELVEAPKPLSMGRAFHYAIEHGEPKRAADMLATDRPITSQEDEDALRVDMAIVVLAAGAYLERWPTQDEAQHEYEFLVRLRNPHSGHYSRTFDLLGYADEIFDHGEGWELVENKLVGQIANVSVRRLPLDRQLAIECYGIWRATGKTVTNVRYRFTRKPSIKKRQGESMDGFIKRLEGDYRQRRDDFYLHEETLFRSTEDLVRIEAELWRWAEQLRAARRESVWARNSSHCADWGGCPYIPLCVGDPDAPALYRQKEISQPTTEEVTLGV